MFDNKNASAASSGCGKLDEKTAMALIEELDAVEEVPEYFLHGVMTGLLFVAIQSGEMFGESVEAFVRNAHSWYIDALAMGLVEDMARSEIEKRGVLVEVRHA